jgi:crossover junction endodeoxyribonuclease RusA
MEQMNREISISLPFKPISVNQMYMIARKRMILTKIGREYKNKIVEYLKTLNLTPIEQKVNLTINVYFKSNRKRDLDNILKPLLDCLTGHLYVDDSQIDELHLYKHKNQMEDAIEITMEIID